MFSFVLGGEEKSCHRNLSSYSFVNNSIRKTTKGSETMKFSHIIVPLEVNNIVSYFCDENFKIESEVEDIRISDIL